MGILVLDDSSLVRVWIQSHLQRIGFVVEPLSPGSVFEVLAKAREMQPDLVITDYEMPHCNGESVIRSLREDPVLRDTPVIVFSSHGEKDLVARLSRWNLWAYLLKPTSVEDFLGAVIREMEARGCPLPELAVAFKLQPRP